MPSTHPVAKLVLSTSIVSLLASAPPLDAVTILVQGGWSKSVGALDLSAGPGSDLIDTQESAPDQGVISIEGAPGPWRVDVRKSDTAWDGELRLALRRTSDGTGSGAISGGGSYVEVGAFDTTLFSGDSDRAGIGVQLRLSGVSAALGASSFSTTVTYTVVED